MATKRVRFMCTAFRDGFQSVYGARVFTPDFLPALHAAKEAGIDYFEAGGGARFQSLYFYCNEDAFAMMDAFRETAGPDANLQTLARGVNVVGLDSQPRDIIKLHAEMFARHGITTIRNFDALNDVDNLIDSGRAITDAGLEHQVVVTLMELPPGCEARGAHTADFYLDTLRKILDAGIPYSSVCFKDASGTAVPSKVYDTIKRARKMLGDDTFIHFHTHDTAGIGVIGNKAALDAGADAIDLAMAPVSGGTSQPDLLLMWHALRGTDFDLGIDVAKVREAEECFKDCMKDYFKPPEALTPEPLIPWSPMPGGALTANTQMLRDNGLMSKYAEIIKAMREVVERGGFGTSVTPVSQFYFQQAFNNVMHGPWKKVAESYGKMVLGYFGKTPVPPDPEIVALASKQLSLEPTTLPVVELNDADPNKGVEAAKKLLTDNGLPADQDEHVFIAAACKEKGVTFLKGEAKVGVRKIDRDAAAYSKPARPKGAGPQTYAVTVEGRVYEVEVNANGTSASVGGRTYAVGTGSRSAPAAPRSSKSGGGTEVTSQMPGLVLRILVAPGDQVDEGQALVVLEAMKMEMEVTAPCAGHVQEIPIAQGDQVAGGALLVRLS